MPLVSRETAITGYAVEIELDEILYERRTRFQHVLIATTRAFGKGLFMDGTAQSFASDEGIYHTALVQPAMLLHPAPKRVLIGGGGEGATLREVLRHPVVERAMMVDIDEEAVEACRRYLPEWHQGAFDDPRADVAYEDIFAWMERAQTEPVDVMILDLGDPTQPGPARDLYVREFYELAAKALAPDGILVTQCGEFDHLRTWHVRCVRSTIASVLPETRVYRVSVPSFCAEWGFVLASRRPLPQRPVDLEARIAAAGGADLPYLDSGTLDHLLWLPPRLRQQVDRPGRILTRAEPLGEHETDPEAG